MDTGFAKTIRLNKNFAGLIVVFVAAKHLCRAAMYSCTLNSLSVVTFPALFPLQHTVKYPQKISSASSMQLF